MTRTAVGAGSELRPHGPFDLATVALLGLGDRDAGVFDGVLRLALCLDGGTYERSVGVEVRQDGAVLRVSVVPEAGTAALTDQEHERLRAQLRRVLSLEHDGAAFAALCAADPALARAHHALPAYRPRMFPSAYEAAVTSVVSARRSRRQGLAQVGRLAQEGGTAFELGGRAASAIPTPSQLLAVESVRGLPAQRVEQLHGVAEAALRGELVTDELRRLPPEEAVARLQRLPGIGPFYSALVVELSFGLTDLTPTAAERARGVVARAHGLEDLDEEAFVRLADGWRPFRGWVVSLLRTRDDQAATTGRLRADPDPA